MFARFSRRRLLGGLFASLFGALVAKPPAAAAPPAPPPAPPPPRSPDLARLDGAGTAAVAGTSASVRGSGLLYCTYLGGSSAPE
jgi:hypothetical protein